MKASLRAMDIEELVGVLRAIESHHVYNNARVGRPGNVSATLKAVRHALDILGEKPDEHGGGRHMPPPDGSA